MHYECAIRIKLSDGVDTFPSKCSVMLLEMKWTCLPGYSSIGDDVQLSGGVLELGVRKNV